MAVPGTAAIASNHSANNSHYAVGRIFMNSFAMNVRYGLRLVRRNPAFASITVIVLALGIAGVAIIFSIVSAVVIRPLPYNEPERLAAMWETEGANPQAPISPDDFIDLKSQSEKFADMAAFSIQGLSLTGLEQPIRVNGSIVSPNFFQVFGVSPIFGRAFTPDDISAGGARQAVISAGLWKRLWGGSESVIGTQVTLNDQPFTITGVMPNNFDFTRLVEVWLSPQLAFPEPPVRYTPGRSLRNLRYLRVVGRLKPGVEFRGAQAEMDAISSRLAEQYPDTNKNIGVHIVPLYQEVVGNVKTSLLLLFGAMVLVLLIACTNVANLLLGRALAREKEFSIRLAMGAGRGQILQQLVTESMLLSLIAGAVGIGLAYLGVKSLPALLPADFPTINEIEMNGPVLAVTLAVSVLTGLLFGLAPAIQLFKSDLTNSLKAATRSATGGRTQRRFQNALIISEVALSLVLLVGAGLMLKSFYNIQKIDLGFNPEDVLTMQISLPRSRYSEPKKVIAFYEQVLEQMETIPGIAKVGATNRLSMTGTGVSGSFAIEGRPASPDEKPNAGWRMVSTDYFAVMGIPLKKGRMFSRDDVSGPRVALINETAASRYWPNEDPVGRRISLDGGDNWVEIIGVAGDVRGATLYAGPTAELYLPFFQTPWNNMVIVAKLNPGAPSPAASLREKVLAVDKNQPVDNIRPLQQIVGEAMSQPRFNLMLISIFTFTALALAAVGLYGVIIASIAHRNREIGIRMAMGAKPADVFKMVLKQGLMLVAFGTIVGLVLAFALNRTIASLLFNVGTRDPIIYGAAALFLCMVAFVANAIPAYRASRINPMIAIREE
jgi:putative ABC transport system permease protein